MSNVSEFDHKIYDPDLHESTGPPAPRRLHAYGEHREVRRQRPP